MMTNVFDELEEFFEATELTWNDVIAAEVLLNKVYTIQEYNNANVRLEKDYNSNDLQVFKNKLKDLNYEKVMFGNQELLGTIWLTNGRWLQRIEDIHFQVERWDLYEYPEFPEYL